MAVPRVVLGDGGWFRLWGKVAQKVGTGAAAVMLLLTLLLLLPCAGCQRAGAAAAAQEEDFHMGRSLVCAGKYQEAIAPLEKYLQEQPQGKNASRAGLFLGKAHLALDDNAAARSVFEETTKNYPGTDEAHKCRYKVAMIALLEDKHDEAAEILDALASNPDGPLAAEALAWSRWLKTQQKPPAAP